MAPLTKDRNTVRKDGIEVAYPVAASTKIYAGSQVCINTSGYAVPAADTAGYKFVGVAQEYVDNSAGANGDLTVRVRRKGSFEFAGAGFTVTDVDKVCFASDDQTVALSTTNSVVVGRIAEVLSATSVMVDVEANTEVYGKEECLTLFRQGTVGTTAIKLAEDFEFPDNVVITRMYINANTAPGSGYKCTLTITDGTTPKTLDLAEANTKAEDEAVNQAYAKDTDMTISIVDDNASAATADVGVVIWFRRKG